VTRSEPAAPAFECLKDGDQVVVRFDGDWLLGFECPPAQLIAEAIVEQQAGEQTVSLRCTELLRWDSQFVSRLYQCERLLKAKAIRFDLSRLPAGVQQLFSVATAVPPSEQGNSGHAGLLGNFDPWLWLRVSKREAIDLVAFVGEITLACGRLIRGQANTRMSDFFCFVQQAGPNAIGIITLVSVLVGMILAYLGLVQLKLFGAEIYVANLVTIGMVREMGALMAAVIMAGRTGAAYAAQLGAMQANEEVDAITTLGISPIDFLVLPRMFALICMMPLICLYADAVGLVGGAIVATGTDITLNQYISQSRDAVTLMDIGTGLFKSLVFGVLIAIAGCKAGIQSGRNSAAVGEATTKAVVTATVYLVVADAGLNIIYDKMGI